MRENLTPRLLRKILWAGANLGSYDQGCQALRELLDVEFVPKQVQRITSQIGSDNVALRQELVEQHRSLPLMQKVAAPPAVAPPDLGVVMMDGGRYQSREHFVPRDQTRASQVMPTEPSPSAAAQAPFESQPVVRVPAADSAGSGRSKTHWREDKVGIVLSMQSEIHDRDPTPEFPEWLARAEVVSQLAHLTSRDEQAPPPDDVAVVPARVSAEAAPDWPDLAPKLKSREVIASGADAQAFGRHLEWKAWTMGVPAAPRQAFVADGLAVNWTIHQRHFSQMTGILDLMHALSYAWRAAEVLADRGSYRRYANWIWRGEVRLVIDELRQHQQQLGLPEKAAAASDPRERVARALTYYENHQHLMHYDTYRQQGLPLTSSHMESTVKLINQRIKGSEKFWREDHAESVLQLRADSLSDSQPLDAFWKHWQAQQTGTNHYRTAAV